MADIMEKLQELAMRKAWLTLEHEEEANALMEEWNSLVPKAEESGMSHKEIASIWYGTKWGCAL